MRRKNKQGSSELHEIKAYLGDMMSEEERNSFERRMEADPFLKDSVEGLSSLSPDEITHDVAELQEEITRRRATRRLPVWYRISAAVVLLLVVSTFFMVREFKDNNRVASSDIVYDEPPVTAEEKRVSVQPVTEKQVVNEAVREVSVPASGAKEAIQKTSTKKDETAGNPTEHTESQPAVVSGINKAEDVKISEAAAEEFLTDTAVSLSTGLAAEAPSKSKEAAPVSDKKTLSRRKSDLVATGSLLSARQVKGTVLSAEDNLPLPGAIITIRETGAGVAADENGNFEISADSAGTLVANYIGMTPVEIKVSGDEIGNIMMEPDMLSLDEVIVTGYASGLEGRSAGLDIATEVEINREDPVFTSASPEGGMIAFRTYVKENLKFPSGYTISDREVVRVRFKVTGGRAPYDFEIVRSPSEEFSREAIRLINEGPEWMPATSDGVPVTQTVSLRIVFRR